MDDGLLRTIAERYGTPTYVYDLGLVRRRLAELRRAFGDASVLYAVKANPNGAVLRTLAAEGAGAEVITLGELERTIRAGFAPRSILVGGPGQALGLVRRAADLQVGLASLDSVGTWRAWSARTPEATRYLVRVNPGLDPATHEHLATGAAGSKFGLPPSEALALAREVGASGRLAGFHVHAGSMIRDAAVYNAIGEVLGPLYGALPGLDRLDLGGGFAVPDLALEPFARRARALAARLGVHLVLEPGRFLVAEAGTLLTRALHVKPRTSPPHLIVDAGMADLLRPALYAAEHPIRVIARHEDAATAPAGDALDDRPTDVDGPLCENADRLGRSRVLSGVSAGTLLAVEQAGAYGFAMASNYASNLRPAEVRVDGSDVRLVRRRERPEDLWRLEDDVTG
jgi:diaminopimelate decarboxylase